MLVLKLTHLNHWKHDFKIFQGQHPTGVELIKPNQDEFQDFLDMVDPIIKNAKGSADGKI